MGCKVLVNTKDLSREEWLKYRKKGIGGSDASGIVGLNKYKNPLSVYIDKVEPTYIDEQSEAAYWGNVLEDVVRKEFMLRTGLKVRTPNKMYYSEEHPFMTANLDGVIYDFENGRGVLECKTASEYKKGEWDEDTVPEEYLIQVMHYLAVTGFNYGYMAVLIGGNKFKFFKIERDEELIKYLIDLERDFWQNHVIPRNPPELDGSEVSKLILDSMFPADEMKGKDEELMLPPEAELLVRRYDKLMEQEKALKTEKEEIKNKLRAMLGNYQVGVIGERKVRWSKTESSSFDKKQLKREYPDIYEKYATTKEGRTFGVKEEEITYGVLTRAN